MLPCLDGDQLRLVFVLFVEMDFSFCPRSYLAYTEAGGAGLRPSESQSLYDGVSMSGTESLFLLF